MAQGFNCAGVKITQPEEVGPVISKLTKAGPSLANVIVSVKPTTPATLSMVGMTDDPNVSCSRISQKTLLTVIAVDCGPVL